MTRSKRRPKVKAAEEAEEAAGLLRESAHARHLRAQQVQAGTALPTPDEWALLAEERDCMTFWRWAGVVLILAACALIVLLIVASGAGWIDFAAGCEPFCETGRGMN